MSRSRAFSNSSTFRRRIHRRDWKARNVAIVCVRTTARAGTDVTGKPGGYPVLTIQVARGRVDSGGIDTIDSELGIRLRRLDAGELYPDSRIGTPTIKRG